MQPNIDGHSRSTMKTRLGWVLLATLALTGIAPRAQGAIRLASYVEAKGGVYSPSASFNIDNIDIETTFDGDTRTGVSGELAIGHYFLPTLALELGIGYFNGKGSFIADEVTRTKREVDFNVVPVILSIKTLVPVGMVDPYGELGIGAYFTKFDVTDNLNTFNGTTTFGMHTGIGMNVNVSPNAFIGVEGRYVWANPSFGDQKIRLNDTEYALNGFKLNGFTTTVGVGYSF